MKQTKTKSVDARRLAETEMDDDDDDVKSFILYSLLSLFSLLNLFLHTRAHKVNAPTRGRPSLLRFRFWARLCSRYACHSFSKAHHALFGLHKSSV